MKCHLCALGIMHLPILSEWIKQKAFGMLSKKLYEMKDIATYVEPIIA